MAERNNEFDPGLLSAILQKETPLLTDEEIDILIVSFRKEREAMLAAEAAGKAKSRKSPINEADKKAKAAEANQMLEGLSPEDFVKEMDLS